ncbi:hypothetical protein [Xanthomonas albilineans]|nr:hypothetical protein [Xanthomonas albilineans]
MNPQRRRPMHDGAFVAEEVPAKHDKTYMPRELAENMDQAHRKHDVGARR